MKSAASLGYTTLGSIATSLPTCEANRTPPLPFRIDGLNYSSASAGFRKLLLCYRRLGLSRVSLQDGLTAEPGRRAMRGQSCTRTKSIYRHESI